MSEVRDMTLTALLTKLVLSDGNGATGKLAALLEQAKALGLDGVRIGDLAHS